MENSAGYTIINFDGDTIVYKESAKNQADLHAKVQAAEKEIKQTSWNNFPYPDNILLVLTNDGKQYEIVVGQSNSALMTILKEKMPELASRKQRKGQKIHYEKIGNAG